MGWMVPLPDLPPSQGAVGAGARPPRPEDQGTAEMGLPRAATGTQRRETTI
jgi:hypothetical protein